MKLFAAYCHNRHKDPLVRVFSTPEKATQFAWKFMLANVAHPDGIQVEEENEPGVLCLYTYKYAEDHAYAFEVELNSEAYD
jgi:hypothetical protein